MSGTPVKSELAPAPFTAPPPRLYEPLARRLFEEHALLTGTTRTAPGRWNAERDVWLGVARAAVDMLGDLYD